MVLVSIIAIFILFFSFIGGMKEGAVKNLFSLVALLVAIPATGKFYTFIAFLLSFLPGNNWENFIGFYIAFGLIMAILYLLFILPRQFIQAIWKKGVIFRLVGGVINFVNASIGIVVLAIVIRAYPIFTWLHAAILSSGIVNWLVLSFGFIEEMLPFSYGSLL